MPEPLTMIRKPYAEWNGLDEPSGTFDIIPAPPEYGTDLTHLLCCVLPDSERHNILLPLVIGAPPEKRGWGWDGNEDCPTITPSIDHYRPERDGRPRETIWHGFVTAGVMVPC